MVWAGKAANCKKHLDRVQRLGFLAMAHVQCSTPTAGLEAILGVVPLDLHTQCVAAQAAYRIRGQNQDRWDGIGRGCLRGHLFWSNQLLNRVDMGDCVNSNKRAIQDLFHEKWRECWEHLNTCCQKKYWIDDPGSLGDATARLDCLTLSTVLQALTGHNYLNYHHHIAGNFSEQNCRLNIFIKCLDVCHYIRAGKDPTQGYSSLPGLNPDCDPLNKQTNKFSIFVIYILNQVKKWNSPWVPKLCNPLPFEDFVVKCK